MDNPQPAASPPKNGGSLFRRTEPPLFTSEEFVSTVLEAGAKLSMDGKGAWRDNIFIERFWRTIKYEEVYLRAYESMSDARRHLMTYLAFYNGRRPHSSLTDRTPDAAYFGSALLAA